MAILAVAIPILPGKLDAWKSVVLDQMTGENGNSHFPGGPGTVPLSSIIAVTREDGGIIG